MKQNSNIELGKVQTLQRKLYRKSKQEKDFRFYSLYDKVSSLPFLEESYRRLRSNHGAGGYDGISFDDIESYGIEKYLSKIQSELKSGNYTSSPVQRVYIPKANGKMRPLGIPTIKDRIVQMSCKLGIEPIFEADFEDTSYGFRPKRSARQAVTKIKQQLKAGRTTVFDADLSSYFDTIPHSKLLILLEKRISDNRIINLIRMWLRSPVIEDGLFVNGSGKSNRVGTPQGGVISPLLANIFLHVMDKVVNNPNGIYAQLGIKTIRYADDFVLMGKDIPEFIIERVKYLLARMGLRLNEEKSRLINAFKHSFDFLGFTFRYCRSMTVSGSWYWNIVPRKQALLKVMDKLRHIFRLKRHYSIISLVKLLNPILRGWKNYYTIPKVSYPSSALQKLTYYLVIKLERFFRFKSQRRGKLYRQIGFDGIVNRFGLINPATSTGSSLFVND
jgi:RNA-directed DNA polymerase